MENNNPTTTEAKVPVSLAMIVAYTGLVALLGITAVAAFYNAGGWLRRGFLELAAFAVVTEIAALVMAACADFVWGRKRSKTVRALAIGILLAAAIGCEAFNGFGGFVAWQDTVAERAEKLVEPQRNAIAAADARLQAGIEAAQARIDAVVRPDCEGLGPLTCASRTEAWEAQTAHDRADLAAKQREFDGLDREVETPAPPFGNDAVVAFLAFIGFIKVCGPWAISIAFQRSAAPKRAKTERGAAPSGAAGGNVVPFQRGEGGKQMVRGLRGAGMSFREIERRTGVPISTQHRWCSN